MTQNNFKENKTHDILIKSSAINNIKCISIDNNTPWFCYANFLEIKQSIQK